MKTHLKYIKIDNKKYKKKISDKINFSVKVPSIATVTGNNNSRIDVNLSYKKDAVRIFNKTMFKHLRNIVKDRYGFAIESDGHVESSIDKLDNMDYVFVNKNNTGGDNINDKHNVVLNFKVASSSPIIITEDDYEVSLDFKFIIDGIDDEIIKSLGSKYSTIKNGKIKHKKDENVHIIVIFDKRQYIL